MLSDTPPICYRQGRLVGESFPWGRDMVGEKLGSFKIEDTLGVGAMGVVYKATHEATGKDAAVKVVNKEIGSAGKTYERFQREAEILKQFRHPNIVRFLALGRYSGTSYIAMEYIQGKTLEQLLVEHGPMGWQEVVELGSQICDALHYAHEHGVVHRDLKPSNLMITDAGRVKLTDFGIAKDLDKTALTATGRTLGTAAYMAPEQIKGSPAVSHKTDLYALGVVLYQMLTGQTPFDGSSPVVLMHCHLNEPVPRPSAKLAEIPRALDDLVVQLMAKAPSERPWDAVAVGDVLNKLRDSVGRGETVPMVWPGETPSGVKRGPRPEGGKKPKKGGKSRSSAVGDRRDRGRDRLVRRLETGGLVLALVAIAAVVGYIVWPPSARYLYTQAETLMASENRHDWVEARTRTSTRSTRSTQPTPTRRRPRPGATRSFWPTSRGGRHVLESPVNTKLNVPADAIEQRYVEFYTLIQADRNRFDDRAAVKKWEELAQTYRSDDPKERPWRQLALHRAEELDREVGRRREMVEPCSPRPRTPATAAARRKR